jgi:hypothetical protein
LGRKIFFFIDVNGKCQRLICNKIIAECKKSNIERHFQSLHKNYDLEFPLTSELRKNKLQRLKSSIQQQQNFF